jgi:hypothetical protein
MGHQHDTLDRRTHPQQEESGQVVALSSIDSVIVDKEAGGEKNTSSA